MDCKGMRGDAAERTAHLMEHDKEGDEPLHGGEAALVQLQLQSPPLQPPRRRGAPQRLAVMKYMQEFLHRQATCARSDVQGRAFVFLTWKFKAL